ncbi:MAG: hypothetical protein WB810_05460 [Candidatus Cybelea sp.]
MSSHERELTISPDEGSVVVPAASKVSVSDTFKLKKQSENAKFSVDDIKIKSHIPPTLPVSYALNPSISGPLHSLHHFKNVVDGLSKDVLSIEITVAYNVSGVSEGQPIITELTAGLTHEKHAETVTTSVFHMVGSATDAAAELAAELGVLAGTLYADYEEFDTLPDGDIQKALKHADTKVASIVNGTTSINVTDKVFAEALAVHDLIDDLYGKLLERAQPPELVDVVP